MKGEFLRAYENCEEVVIRETCSLLGGKGVDILRFAI